MTNKKFIALNLLATVAGVIFLAFSNGIISFDKTVKQELPQKQDLLVVPVRTLIDTASVCPAIIMHSKKQNKKT